MRLPKKRRQNASSAYTRCQIHQVFLGIAQNLAAATGASRFTYLEYEVHAVFGLVEQSSAYLPVLELHRHDASFGVVQKDDGHADAGIARDGHCQDKSNSKSVPDSNRATDQHTTDKQPR